ncbi:hypothetical protein [Solidesulfovibrio sp.]|uniref:hypothetical protein n=1 Tax=Solidesulfovibrio sp. TaxID=2910990 RepID=UPI00260E9145|nr:hypothetical protein [Solidesulfovibrio sp.]
MRKILGWILFLAGAWMLVSPQSLTGLKQLKWMADYAFPGEVILGIALLTVALYLVEIKPRKGSGKPEH